MALLPNVASTIALMIDGFDPGDDLYPAAEEVLACGASGFTAIDSIGPTLQIDIDTAAPTLH